MEWSGLSRFGGYVDLSCGLLLGGFCVDGEFDVVADGGRCGRFLAEVEGAALEGAGGGEAGDHLAVTTRLRGGGAVYVEGDGLGDAGEGEVSGDLEAFGVTADGGGFEGDGGVLLDVEEVGAFEVGISPGGVGVDGVGVEGDVDAAFGDVFVVPDEGADDAGDAAANVADAHVTDLEVSMGVGGIEHPGGGLGEGGGAGEEKSCGEGGEEAAVHVGLLEDRVQKFRSFLGATLFDCPAYRPNQRARRLELKWSLSIRRLISGAW